jgi:hypothetical protein
VEHIVEIDAHCRFGYGNNLATEHIKELELALSQIPRVVEFLQSGEKEVWEDLREDGWEWIPPQSNRGHGLCWDFLGDYVCVTEA